MTEPSLSPINNSQTLSAHPQQRAGQPLLWLLLILHAALFLAQLPTIYEFATFAVFDPGSALRADQLIAQGFTPTIDFGYPYGLLPLMIGRAFFALVGRTPLGYVLFMFLAEAALLWGIWRLARNWHWLIALFLLAALPHIIIPVYVNLTHPLEAALIIHALVELVRGQHAKALAIATASLFVKPVMAYVFGFWVLALLVGQVRTLPNFRARWSSFFSMLRPAAVTGMVCGSISVMRFGWSATANALLPLNGAQSYKAHDFGFFANGRIFWLPKLGSAAQFARYYAFTPAGFWIVCTLLLAVFGFQSWLKWKQTREAQLQTMLVIAACHFCFLFGFFGWQGSWTYYSSLLITGVALGCAVQRVRPALLVLLILLALSGHAARWQNTANAWRWMSRAPSSAGLWAFADLRDEWAKARTLAGERKIFYLNNGCAELLFPGIDAPVSFFLAPGSQTPGEFERIRTQLKNAAVVVTYNQSPVLDPWNFEEFADERKAFVETWHGVYLTVHERH
ncbi:MAG: hypothetical protein HOP19_22875 [Acidobacteria bacterium]|nr:hypothetical protein [Acidobacteriota bacterium]